MTAGERRRRKQARPQEIVEAALHEFAARGFAATRLDDVARRAGVAKGTIYLYFAGKEALFQAVVRSAVVPQIERADALVERFEGSSEELLRLLLHTLRAAVAQTELCHIVRLVIAEAARFPDLARAYFDEVIRRGMRLMRRAIARGVATGEFRESALDRFPQALVAPILLGIVWKGAFDRFEPLDFAGLVDAHLDLLLDGLRARP